MAAGILFAAVYDRPVHIAHISLKEEILLIKAAKERGIGVRDRRLLQVVHHSLERQPEGRIDLGVHDRTREAENHAPIENCSPTPRNPRFPRKRRDAIVRPGRSLLAGDCLV
jgi:hypothetical protein